MIFVIEAIAFCFIFTALAVGPMFKNPLYQIHNYPPAIVERALELGLVDSSRKHRSKKTICIKMLTCLLFTLLLSTLVYWINGARTFLTGFTYSYLLWLIVDWYDAIVLDVGLFCHCKRFILPGTEDMVKDYHDYWFHIKGSIIGMVVGLPVCLLTGVVVAIASMV